MPRRSQSDVFDTLEGLLIGRAIQTSRVAMRMACAGIRLRESVSWHFCCCDSYENVPIAEAEVICAARMPEAQASLALECWKSWKIMWVPGSRPAEVFSV